MMDKEALIYTIAVSDFKDITQYMSLASLENSVSAPLSLMCAKHIQILLFVILFCEIFLIYYHHIIIHHHHYILGIVAKHSSFSMPLMLLTMRGTKLTPAP